MSIAANSNALLTKEALQYADREITALPPTLKERGIASCDTTLKYLIAEAFESGRRFGRREAVHKIQDAMGIAR